MTMSLSVARPMVCDPAGFWIAPDRDGRSAWNILVARFATSGGLALAGAARVGAGMCCAGGGLWTGACRGELCGGGGAAGG